jgi:hypothetical protein
MHKSGIPIRVAVRALDIDGSPAAPTAIELSAALTYVHRLVNRAATSTPQGRNMFPTAASTQFMEPGLLNVEIASVANGSVIIDAFIVFAAHPFAQSVASGVLANLITPALSSAASSMRQSFRRISSPSTGRTLSVDIDVQGQTVQVSIQHSPEGRTQIRVHSEER